MVFGQLGNLCVLGGEALITVRDCVSAGCLDEVYVNFPEPPGWSGSKLRLINDVFLMEVCPVSVLFFIGWFMFSPCALVHGLALMARLCKNWGVGIVKSQSDMARNLDFRAVLVSVFPINQQVIWDLILTSVFIPKPWFCI